MITEPDIHSSIPLSRDIDTATAKLIPIWKAVLGVDAIDPDQDYFDLGGDSSLAVHLFTQIEKAFKIKLPLATLYEAPTIRGQAAILCNPEAISGWSTVVAIQPKGLRPPFFCIHGAGGNVLIYRDLSQTLGLDQPFYGLQSKGLDGRSAPLDKVEDMAKQYVAGIRSVQLHGPYLIGGYCLGGTIAFEVAQQLCRQGERVALLALFDTMNWSKVPAVSAWAKAYYLAQKFGFHIANFFRLAFRDQLKFLQAKVGELHHRIPVWWGSVIAKLGKYWGARNTDAIILSRIWGANDRASLSYRPRPYPGTVTDFRPAKQYRLFSSPDLKWEELSKSQEVVVLPVYPAGMLVEPFVHHLAKELEKAIDRTLASSRTVNESSGG